MKHRWAKFFWDDWETDPALRLCSLAAQGLWMRCLCIAAKAEPYGYVSVSDRPLDPDDLARLTGAAVAEVRSLLAELDRNGVFSRDRKGRMYSRRMVRDEKKARTAEKFGKMGGNPNLCNDTEKPSTLNPPDKPPDKLQEANKQKARDVSNETSDSSDREFSDWYAGYPRHEGRGQALRAYRAARRKVSAAELLAGRDRYAAACRGKEPQFIRLPATWLNGEGWLDEPPSARPDNALRPGDPRPIQFEGPKGPPPKILRVADG